MQTGQKHEPIQVSSLPETRTLNLRVNQQDSDRFDDRISHTSSFAAGAFGLNVGGRDSSSNLHSPGIANLTQQLIADTSASATQIIAQISNDQQMVTDLKR